MAASFWQILRSRLSVFIWIHVKTAWKGETLLSRASQMSTGCTSSQWCFCITVTKRWRGDIQHLCSLMHWEAVWAGSTSLGTAALYRGTSSKGANGKMGFLGLSLAQWSSGPPLVLLLLASDWFSWKSVEGWLLLHPSSSDSGWTSRWDLMGMMIGKLGLKKKKKDLVEFYLCVERYRCCDSIPMSAQQLCAP